MSPDLTLSRAELSSLLLCLLAAGCLTEMVRYHTYEEDAPGTVIGVLWDDLQSSSGDRPLGSFWLMEQFSNSSLVRVREGDGQLSIGEEGIDRERLCGQSLQCVLAFDVVSFWQEQYRLVHVELEVRDINDNAPRFPQAHIPLEVSESAAPGTRLPLEIAVDPDVGSNSIQSFQLSRNSHFGIEAQPRADGGKSAELVLLQELDRETQAAYTLELVAQDGGSPARAGTATVSVRVLDANDNSPAFPQGSVTVELGEDAPRGSLLLDLDAADPDEGPNGEIVYGFGSQVPAEARQLFRLDPLSGRLTLEGPVDYERQRTYELDVQAQDRGASPLAATCKVIVRLADVNDNAPGISISPLSGAPAGAGVAYVSEAAARDSFVALVSTSDRDSGPNGQVRCALYGHEHFALQRAYADSYVLVTAAPLDRERVAEYNLTLVAEDLGSPPFKSVRQYTVRVSDENDNAPLFSKPVYEVAVLENNPPGAYLATVVARDPDLGRNGKVLYRLLETESPGGGPGSALVSVDPRSGSVRARQPLDCEELPLVEAEIEACDGGAPQLCQRARLRLRVVDQNDNAPVITSPPLANGSAELPLPASAPAGYLIARFAASDADQGANSELSYSLLGGAHPVVALNRDTGELALRRRLPGGAAGAAFPLIVAVHDGGRPSLSCTAAVRLVPTDTLPSSVEIVVVQPSAEELQLQPSLDLSVVLIAVLAGGCGLLLIAIIAVASTCRRSKSHFQPGPEEQGRGKEARLLKGSGSQAGSSYSGQAGSCQLSVATESDNPSDTSEAEESSRESLCHSAQERKARSRDSQGQVLVPFHPPCLWQERESALSLSSQSTPDQFSAKDSGKGDSEFNDSDSDISGEGLKRPPSQSAEKQVGTAACTDGQTYKETERYCRFYVHQSQTSKTIPLHYENDYTVAYSTPIYQPILQLGKPNFLPQQPKLKEYQVNIPKTERLQSVFERVLSDGPATPPTTLSRQYKGLNLPPQNTLLPSASEVATSF
ncbi:protocadherin-8-like [Chelonoidis abingdonii]|uniref:protocadherin-8-like n=1 Tax=Chelonoidis abingdonii TaxID=106734 RepID=UPI0013F26C91|nr:protocadherin-8-like [Chelonoidis abingdonii]